MATRLLQQLLGNNISPNLNEALAARVKDPLWFLARQWQSGEFEAENGGKPSTIRFSARTDPFQSVTLGNEPPVVVTGAEPLDALVEAEENDAAPAWEPTQLDYGFALTSQTRQAVASDYTGKGLDWYHFDNFTNVGASSQAVETVEMTPNQMGFRGAPYPRWWRFEDSEEDFDAAADPEPNVLSMLLPEFFYVDVNNWYLVPAPVKSGSFREITSLTVSDSFGVTTTLNPVADQNWQVFTLNGLAGNANTSVLMAPNIAIDVVDNDIIEDVRFVRDEGSNLIWAFEQVYTLPGGERVINNDSKAKSIATAIDPNAMAAFHLSSETADAWIPYVPRHIDQNNGLGQEVRLRRGRTRETANAANPQYKSKVVAESKYLNEEEIPRTGLRVRRVHRYARGSDGKPWFWVGRSREAGRASSLPGLRFDYLDK